MPPWMAPLQAIVATLEGLLIYRSNAFEGAGSVVFEVLEAGVTVTFMRSK